MSETPGRYQRSPNALIGSMLVVLVVIVGFVVLRTVSRGNQDVEQPTVAYAAAARQARSEGLVLAVAPATMPSGWRATSVRYRTSPPTWHVGIVTEQKTYVAIEEAGRTPSDLVAAYLGSSAKRGGTTALGGVEWTTWSTSDNGYALTYRVGQDTVYVGGPAGRAAARTLAARLDLAGRTLTKPSASASPTAG